MIVFVFIGLIILAIAAIIDVIFSGVVSIFAAIVLFIKILITISVILTIINIIPELFGKGKFYERKTILKRMIDHHRYKNKKRMKDYYHY